MAAMNRPNRPTGEVMQTRETSEAKLTAVAVFPPNSFLENLAVRADGSVLVTEILQHQLWYVPPPAEGAPADPVPVHTFGQFTMGITEAEPDMFYVNTSDPFTAHRSFLHRLDLRHWNPGEPAPAETVLEFPGRAGGLNGSCLLAPAVLVLADSLAGLIWRVDLPDGGCTPTARVWLEHDSLAPDPGGAPVLGIVPQQPGVNGVRYAPRDGHLYYTSTGQKLFMRVPVHPGTYDPAGAPEFVAGGTMADDFCLDEDAGVAYVTTHRQNTIDRVPLQPGSSGTRQIVAGDPFDEQLAGPSSAAWGRRPGDYGRVVYVTSDGGLVAPPPDGIVQPAKLLRAELPTTGAPDTTRAPVQAMTDGARTRRQTQPRRHVPAPGIPPQPRNE
jgi:hypothetical protein